MTFELYKLYVKAVEGKSVGIVQSLIGEMGMKIGLVLETWLRGGGRREGRRTTTGCCVTGLMT